MLNALFIFSKKYSKNFIGIPVGCRLSLLLIALNSFTIGVCFFISLYFVNILHFDILNSGALMSCYGIGSVMGGIAGGKLSDIYFAKNISIISNFILAIAFAFLIILKTPMLLMLNMFLLGCGAYGFKTSNNTWNLSLCGNNPDLRYKIINLSHISSNVGLNCSAALIYIISQYGFHIIFSVSSFLLVVVTVYLAFDTNDYMRVTNNNNYLETNKQAVSRTSLAKILLCVFLTGLVIAQLGSTYPIFIQNKFNTFGLKAVSFLFILDTSIIIIFQAPLTSWVSTFNKYTITGIGALFMGMGLYILNYANNFSVAIISCIIWTVGEMLFISTAQLICYENSSSKNKGQSLGLFQTALATSNIIGPTLGSAIYQVYGSQILWYSCAIIGLTCFSLCLHNLRSINKFI